MRFLIPDMKKDSLVITITMILDPCKGHASLSLLPNLQLLWTLWLSSLTSNYWIHAFVLDGKKQKVGTWNVKMNIGNFITLSTLTNKSKPCVTSFVRKYNCWRRRAQSDHWRRFLWSAEAKEEDRKERRRENNRRETNEWDETLKENWDVSALHSFAPIVSAAM